MWAKRIGSAGLGGLVGLSGGLWYNWINSLSDRMYTMDDVAAHDSTATGIWVSYEDRVLDVTNFVQEHPGGYDMIMQAAGGPVDYYWAYWARHLNSKKVQPEIEKYTIGRLSDWDGIKVSSDSLYSSDPIRDTHKHAILEGNGPYPCRSQTTPKEMAKQPVTATDAFYVRNHAPVPGPFSHVHVGDLRLSLDELKDFGEVEVRAAMQCAGNRSTQKFKDFGGDAGKGYVKAGIGMIGNADWKGVEILPILKKAYGDIKKGQHIVFEGADGYSASIPAELAEERPVLLVYGMNGQSIPPDHGFPMRVIVPGVIGARCVKWVTSITLSDEECNSCWQKKFYRNRTKALVKAPIQSMICSLNDNEAVHPGVLEVVGIAWGGSSGKRISRVEMSYDAGRTWHECELLDEQPCYQGKFWGWNRWSYTLKVPSEITGNTIELVCRAYDSSGATQPESVTQESGTSGYLYNGWHRLSLRVVA